MFWYRYLQPTPIRVNLVTLNPRGVYAVSCSPSGVFSFQLENGESVPVTDRALLETILAASRPMTGKATVASKKLDDIEKLCKERTLTESERAKEEDREFNVAPGTTRSIASGVPNIPKSQPLALTFAETKVQVGSILIHPISPEFHQNIQAAMSYIGTRHVARAKTFFVGESPVTPTCMISIPSKQSYGMILNFPQLKRLSSRGVVDVAIIAQAITHEYAHYKWHAGALRETDKIKFTRAIAARGLHPDIFKHPGYDYPWYEEAWAVLCEYMVHGTSARGLASTEGWEIAQKYFDNNYLKGGRPSGDRLVSIN